MSSSGAGVPSRAEQIAQVVKLAAAQGRLGYRRVSSSGSSGSVRRLKLNKRGVSESRYGAELVRIVETGPSRVELKERSSQSGLVNDPMRSVSPLRYSPTCRRWVREALSRVSETTGTAGEVGELPPAPLYDGLSHRERRTCELKLEFLRQLGLTGTVSGAATTVGVSRRLVEQWVREDSVFADDLELVRSSVHEILESELIRRALKGNDRLLLEAVRASNPSYRSHGGAHYSAQVNIKKAVVVDVDMLMRRLEGVSVGGGVDGSSGDGVSTESGSEC